MGKMPDELKSEAPDDQLHSVVNTLSESFYSANIVLPLAVYRAVEEVADATSRSMDQIIQAAIERELRRRGVTWWETRVQKIIRTYPIKNVVD